MKNIFSLKGKKALITGASSGIGKEMALTLADAGADVALLSRRIDVLEDLCGQIEAKGTRAISSKMDIGELGDIERAVEEVLEEFQTIDILINNAGIEGNMPMRDISPDFWNQVSNVNLRGHVFCTQKVGESMIEQKSGKIINISSIMGIIGLSQGISYCASKAGIIAFTKSLALEWARYNIQVNAICPGYILTDINKKYFDTENGKRTLKKIPMRRYGMPEELRGACLLLASGASSFMTGTVIVVDGGQIV